MVVVQAIDSVRRRASGRVPPHNLEAEESLLGAMLLSRDAITAAVEAHVEASDFYKPAHGHIYEAIQSLYGAGRAGRSGHRRRGAPPRRSARQHRWPFGAAPDPGRHARRPPTRVITRAIVNELALLRRLIGVAGDIAEMGYDESDDVTETLDRAEALVFEVAERRVSDSMVGIRDALQDTLDELEARYGDDSELVGVPTGFDEVDKKLHGLQRSNLVILAARPGMGKTSLALGHGEERRHPDRPAGRLLLDGDGRARAHQAAARDGGAASTPPASGPRKLQRGRLGEDQPRGRSARRGPAAHRRQPALHGDGDARPRPVGCAPGTATSGS